MQLRHLQLFRANMGVPVQLDTGTEGIAARVLRTGPDDAICVMVESEHNRGVASNDCYERFAWAVCDRLGLSPEGVEWFRLDQEGRFEEVHLDGTQVAAGPLIEPPFLRCSREAMLARLNRLGISSREARTHLLGDTQPSPGQAYRNDKNGRLYRVTGSLINATNAQDGQRLVKYVPEASPQQEFAREVSEFHQKFSVVFPDSRQR